MSAPTASGRRATLTVRVNGVAWWEVPSLYGLAPDARAFIVRIADDGSASLVFGDGAQGARLPSGADNVVATYRSGTGPEGEVDAGTLTMPMAQPLGIKAVSNPLPATGAEAPERLDDARRNAPLTVLTLDRIVSLADVENFSAAFPGIGKARAVELWSGTRRLVHVTVAAASGAVIADKDPLLDTLRQAIDRARAPLVEIAVAGHDERLFNLKATLTVDPARDAAEVEAAVREELRASFAFARRTFAEPVTAAEIVALMHRVPGVIAVDLDQLYDVTDAAGPKQTSPPALLTALPARFAGAKGGVEKAQLLLVNPVGIALTEVTL